MAGCLSTKLCVMDFSPPNDNDVPTIRADPPLFEPSPGSFQAPEITPGAFAHAQDAVTKSIHRQLHQIPEAESYESNNFVPFTRSVKPTPFYGGSGVSRDDPHVDEQHHEDDCSFSEGINDHERPISNREHPYYEEGNIARKICGSSEDEDTQSIGEEACRQTHEEGAADKGAGETASPGSKSIVVSYDLPSPAMTGGAGSPDLPDLENTKSLDPQDGGSCIAKAVGTTRRMGPQNAAALPSASRIPTEEDLLLLLMRRQRIRRQEHQRLAISNDQLRIENLRLKDEGNRRAVTLENAEKHLQELFLQGNVREADFKAFREKYEKLKIWAAEMHKEYAEAYVEAEKIAQEISDLKTEKHDQANERARILRDLEEAAQRVNEQKNLVSELQKCMNELEKTRALLRHAQGEIREGKLQNQEYVLHISRLETSQQTMNRMFTKGQDAIRAELAGVVEKLRKYESGSLQPFTEELMEPVRLFLEETSTKGDISKYFSVLMTTAETKFSKISAEIANLGQINTEQRSLQDLENTIRQLKLEHEAALATSSMQIRNETDKQLASAKESVDELTKRYTQVCLEKEAVENDLVFIRSEMETLREELASERAQLECLRRHSQRLTDQSREKDTQLEECNVVRLQLENSKNQGEYEKLTLQNDLKHCEAEKQKYQEEAKSNADKVAGLQHQVYNLEETREQNAIVEAQLREARATMGKQDVEIALLKTEQQSNEVAIDKLRNDFKIVKESAEKVPELLAEVDKAKDKAVELERALDLVDNHRQEQANKDDEIHELRKMIKTLEKERQSCSTLIELLTDGGRFTISEVEARLRKDVRHFNQRTITPSEVEAPRLRRAANRNTNNNGDEIVVQDPQETESNVQQRNESDTSELSEPPDGFEHFGPGDIESSVHSSLSSIFNAADRDQSPDVRPGTSNHEMLLRSSDVGGYTHPSRSQATILVHGMAPDVSPMRTRGGSQICHGIPVPQTVYDGQRVINFMTPPPPSFREINVPNSAIKRRHTSDASEATIKRRNIGTKDLGDQPTRTVVASASTQTSNMNDNTGRFSGPRTSSIGIAMPVPGKMKKATNSTRTTSKSAKMQAQFNTDTV